jgi:hypothetical protein
VRRPAELGDVTFVWVEGPDFENEALELVLVRKRGWWEGLKGVMGRSKGATVVQAEATAERVRER